ncbi:MAG: ABC transporter permease [Nannocystaceae bacterium]|nr:ABC transporter permease [Nannocystaceae bacterium]
MKTQRLAGIVVGNLNRSRNHFLLASVGVVVGIATFAFFLSLGLGVRKVVLGKIFPLDKIEVVPKTMNVNLGPLRLGLGNDSITDETVTKLGALPGVAKVYPKMKLTVPSIGMGGEAIFGSDLRSELVADGIEPSLVVGDIHDGWVFEDFDDPARPENKQPPKSCKTDEDCGDRMWCGEASGTMLDPGVAQGFNRKRAKKPKKGDPEPEPEIPTVCRHYIPIVASHHIVELYNGTLRRAHNFPQLNPEAIRGFTFDLVIGASMVRASRKDKALKERGQLVGFSDKAIPLGLTMPLGYAQRFNVAFGSEQDAERYHSVILEVPSKDDVAMVAKGVEGLDLKVKDSGAEQAAVLIAVFMLVFGLVSAVIVGIAAVNIMHVFFMLVYERQREIGVMRAVGASKGDVARIILGEAAALGVLAGVTGLLLAVGAGYAADAISVSYVPDFPYKPETYFEFPWWLSASSVGFAISFCILGAFLPARRAANMEPAIVLSGQ